MTLREVAVAFLSGGICSLLAWNAGIREGLERAAKLWRGEDS
jgi:hypothetical protein